MPPAAAAGEAARAELGGGAVVDELGEARALGARHPDVAVVTRGGDLLATTRAGGGSASAPGVLRLESALVGARPSQAGAPAPAGLPGGGRDARRSWGDPREGPGSRPESPPPPAPRVPGPPARGPGAGRALGRTAAAGPGPDRYLAPEIEAVTHLVATGAVTAAASAAVGHLT